MPGSIFSCNISYEHEVIVVNTSSGDNKTNDYLSTLSKEKPNITYCIIPQNSKGKARNHAIKIAKGDILYFFDDDIEVGKNTFKNLIEIYNKYPNIAAAGGPNLTPPNSNLFQKASGCVLESWFGSASMKKRYSNSSSDCITTSDQPFMLCNLSLKKAYS